MEFLVLLSSSSIHLVVSDSLWSHGLYSPRNSLGQNTGVDSLSLLQWIFLTQESVELFKIMKDEAVKVLHSIWQQIWETQQWPQNWKSQFSSQFQRRRASLLGKALGVLYPMLRYHPGQRCICMVTESTILLQGSPKLCKSGFVSRQWYRMVQLYISVLEGIQDTLQDELVDILKSISPTLSGLQAFSAFSA